MNGKYDFKHLWMGHSHLIDSQRSHIVSRPDTCTTDMYSSAEAMDLCNFDETRACLKLEMKINKDNFN